MGEKNVNISNVPKSAPLKAIDSWINTTGTNYILPQKVDILFENGWRECHPVTWDKLVDTSAAGEQVINGTVSLDDQTFSCKLTATVK